MPKGILLYFSQAYHIKVLFYRALEESSGGVYMSIPLLKKVIEEENEILQVNHPDRNIKITQAYVVHFGARHNLFEKSRERRAQERENYEHQCDVCFGKYATAKLLTDHKKVTHFAFLNTHLKNVQKKKSWNSQFPSSSSSSN